MRTDASGTDRPAVHAQTLATYRLLDELRARHPDLEIESCSSGGARVDLGVLARTDRVWTSDCNDAVERVAIQRWTGLLVPPERMGSHVGPPRAHTTHRDLDLSLRMLVALGGHAGLEWDITTCTPDELEVLRRWSGLYRELRPLLHGGDAVRSDHPDDAVWVSGVVAPDRSDAVFTVVSTVTGRGVTPGTVPLPGLDPGRRYRVRVRTEAGLPATVQAAPPAWWDDATARGHRRERGGTGSGRPGHARARSRAGLPAPPRDRDRLTPGGWHTSRRGHRPRRADAGIPRLHGRAAPGDLHDAAP